MPKMKTLLFLLLLMPLVSFTQKYRDIYLIPLIGNENALSRFDNKATVPEPYKRTAGVGIGAMFSIGVVVDFNQDFLIQLGLKHGAIGSGVYHWSNNGLSTRSGKRYTGSGVGRLYLDVSKPFKTVYIKRFRRNIFNKIETNR